jgi:hypothetical protein
MIALAHPTWQPTCIRRVVRTYPSGSEAVDVVTDAGRGFAKFLGGKEGPHVLACESIGTQLAELLGLNTFDFTVFDYDGVPEIELNSGSLAQAGPAWVTRYESGFGWSGEEQDLKHLSNTEHLSGLVVLDTWTLNCDRYCPASNPTRINRHNVFFSMRAGEDVTTVLAMDHSHILTCGRALTPKLNSIDQIKSENIFGFFPAFKKLVTASAVKSFCNRMGEISDQAIYDVVDGIPEPWLEDVSLRKIISRFLIDRRDYLATDLATRIVPQTELDF